jgi:CRP-like cAMP-binding protein
MSMIGQKDIEVPEGEFICMLSYENYLSAEALGETTIEKELNFWDSSEYFCSMPRKKILQMMKEADIRVFHQNETAFFQGQQVTKTESGSGVYIVRTGEFSYFRLN